MSRVRKARVWPFIVVGGIGFVIDAAVLSWLVHAMEWRPLRARIVSFFAAVTATWAINRRYTFADRRSYRAPQEYSRYIATQTLGAVLNYAVFAAAILMLPVIAHYPVLPLALGSGVAMFFNYFAMQRWVFATPPAGE